MGARDCATSGNADRAEVSALFTTANNSSISVPLNIPQVVPNNPEDGWGRNRPPATRGEGLNSECFEGHAITNDQRGTIEADQLLLLQVT